MRHRISWPFLTLLGCIAATGPTAAQTAAERLDGFVRTRGADLEACFRDLPELDAGARRGQFAGPTTAAPTTAAPRVDRLMLAVDASGSMAGRVGKQTKMDTAKAAARDFLAEAPADVSVGLIAFGHRGNNADNGKAESCAGVETVYPMGASNQAAVTTALARFSATGWTPLAQAIERAGQSFAPQEAPGAQVVYVVSDGKETCGGDPVAAARALHEGPVKAIVNIIGFDLADADRAQLRAVAQAGGGTFVEARSADEFRRQVADVRRRAANLRELTQATAANTRTQVANTARTTRAVTQLTACVTRGVTQETARLYPWLREQDFSEAERQQVSQALQARHRAYQERRSAVNDAAFGARDRANRDAQDANRDNQRGFDAAR